MVITSEDDFCQSKMRSKGNDVSLNAYLVTVFLEAALLLAASLR